MKILTIYNKRATWGGEDFMVEHTVEILSRNGHEVDLWTIDNTDLLSGIRGKITAFFSGIYSLRMKREMEKRLEKSKPDVVHAHNLYPLFSASVLSACRTKGVPALVHCHNYFLSCPIGTHLRNGEICEQCSGGKVLPCILNDCRNNLPESLGYALRSKAAKMFDWFRSEGIYLLVMSKFAAGRLQYAGYAQNAILILPNFAHDVPILKEGLGDYVVYVGRLSQEKGVNILIEAARKLPHISFRLAGDGPQRAELEKIAPSNVSFEGWLDRVALSKLYKNARLAIAPSICFETFGLSLVDAMAHGVPVVASNLGAFKEVIRDGKTGFLFATGDADDLAEKTSRIWRDAKLASDMSKASYSRVSKHYTSQAYYEGLIKMYNHALKNGRVSNEN